MTSWAQRREDAANERAHDFKRARRLARLVPCTEPGCEKPAGEDCWNVRTHQQPLENQAAHHRRVVAGEAFAAENESDNTWPGGEPDVAD